MPFDSGVCAAIANELNKVLADAKVEKIHQPSKDSLMLQLHPRNSEKKSVKLIIDAGASNSRICLTEASFENPPVPSSMCMFLRKKLSGAKIDEISQVGFDRVIRISFSCFDELGYAVKNTIYAEIMGRFGNIIFVGPDNRVILATKMSDISSSGVRPVYPGMEYCPPPSDRINPLTIDADEMAKKVGDEDVSKSLLKYCLGFSPLTAREIEYRTSFSSLNREISLFSEKINSGVFHPCILKKKSGELFDFSFDTITQYGEEITCSECGTMSETIDLFFSSRATKESIDSRCSDVRHLLNGIKNRIETKIEKQTTELGEYEGKDALRKKADLIISNLYLLKKGMLSANVVDYEDENCPTVKLELDPILSPSQYATKLYKQYTKSKNGEIKLKELISEAKNELEYIETVISSLDTVENSNDIDDIRRELSESGYIKYNDAHPSKTMKSQPLYFKTTNGYSVICGKNNKQNDYITHKLATKDDIWFHINGYHGSHVVLFAEGSEPEAEDYTDAALIAASYSSAQSGQRVRVDYTKVKNIKKPPMSKPGFVTFSTNYSAYVVSDRNSAEKMLDKNIKK